MFNNFRQFMDEFHKGRSLGIIKLPCLIIKLPCLIVKIINCHYTLASLFNSRCLLIKTVLFVGEIPAESPPKETCGDVLECPWTRQPGAARCVVRASSGVKRVIDILKSDRWMVDDSINPYWTNVSIGMWWLQLKKLQSNSRGNHAL